MSSQHQAAIVDREEGDKLHDQEHALEMEHEHLVENGTPLREIPVSVSNLPRILGLGLIRVYQATLSKTIPSGTCRFYPTCSHYGYEAIVKHGLFKGSGLAIWRVARCQPFSEGGYDPVP